MAPVLAQLAESQDWAALAAAIRRVLDGERDIDRAILHQILAGIAASAGGRAVDD